MSGHGYEKLVEAISTRDIPAAGNLFQKKTRKEYIFKTVLTQKF